MTMSDDADHFSLRWNNFHSNLTSGFHSLLQSEDLVDVTLAAGGQLIQAHKIVLSVCSPYFKQLFKVNPCKHPIVILKDVSYKELVSILQFMYKGEVNVRQEELSDFLKTAETLQIKGLTGDDPPAEDPPVNQPRNATPPPVARTIDHPFKRRSVTPSHSPKPPSASSSVPRAASAKRPRVERTVASNLTAVPNPTNIQNNVVQFVSMNTPKCEPVDYDSDIEELDSKSEAMVRLLEGETSLSHQDDADSHQSRYDSPLQQVESSPSHLQSLGTSIHSLIESSPAVLSSIQDSADESLVGARARNVRCREQVDHFTKWSDEEFFVRFRLTKPTVLRVLGLVTDYLEQDADRNPSAPPVTQLLLTLRFYASGRMLPDDGDFTSVHRSLASGIVDRVSEAIARLRPQFVHFPQTAEGMRELKLGFYQMNGFPRVIGAIDCVHIRIQSPERDDAEVFRNRRKWFSLNIQTVCDHRTRITDIVARYPGSSPDHRILNNSLLKARLEMGEFRGCLLLGDRSYALKSYLVTPLRAPVLPEHHRYNEAHVRTRSTVDRLHGAWKRRFPVLALGSCPAVPVQTTQAVVVACAVLHNIAVDVNEAEPPQDPDVPPVDAEGDCMPDSAPPRQGKNDPHDGNSVQCGLVEYFRQRL